MISSVSFLKVEEKFIYLGDNSTNNSTINNNNNNNSNTSNSLNLLIVNNSMININCNTCNDIRIFHISYNIHNKNY